MPEDNQESIEIRQFDPGECQEGAMEGGETFATSELGDGVQSGSGHGDLDLDGYLQDISRPGEHWKRDCFFNVGDWNATASLVGFIRLRLFADGTLYIEGGCYVIAFTKEGRKPRPIWRDCGLTSWGIPSQEATLDRLMRGLEGHLAEAVTLFADQRRAGRA